MKNGGYAFHGTLSTNSMKGARKGKVLEVGSNTMELRVTVKNSDPLLDIRANKYSGFLVWLG